MGKTKENIKIAIKEYIYSCLSVDKDSFSKIDEDYYIPLLNNTENNYMQSDEDKKRIEIVNNFRVAFNKLTTEERKMIYRAYLDCKVFKRFSIFSFIIYFYFFFITQFTHIKNSFLFCPRNEVISII